MDIAENMNDTGQDFGTQLAEIARQQKLAQALRARADAYQESLGHGTGSGANYVPTAPTQFLAQMLQQYQAQKAEQGITEKQRAIDTAMAEHAQQWRNSLPQAVAAQKGMAPNLVMESPEGQAGTPDIPAQPVTAQQVLRKTLAASGNPLLAKDAALYEKASMGEIDREDKQVQQKALLDQQQVLGREKLSQEAVLRSQALEQQAAAAKQRSEDTRLSIEQRAQAQQQHNDLMRELQTSRIEAKGSTEKPLPAHLATAFVNNSAGMKQVEAALDLVRKNEDAFSLTKGMLPQAILTRTDPEGVTARGAVADLGSLRIHDRTGAAMTAREEPRLIPFIPSPTDNAETVKKKLAGFQHVYNDMQNSIADFAENQGYKSPRALMTPTTAPTNPTGLTPEEQAELDKLRTQFPKGR